MSGHIRKRGKKWEYKLELDRDPTTNRRRAKWYTGFATKKAAEADLTKVLHQRQTGTFVEPSRVTVAEYLRKWIEDYARTNVAGKTFERYKQIVENNLVPGLGGISLHKLQPLQIQSLYAEQLQHGRKKGEGGLSAQTVLHHHRVLRKALAQAVRWNLLVANPADRVEPPRVDQKEVQPIDAVAADWLITCAEGTRVYMAIMLAIYTGLRRGEILALRWQDVDLVGCTVTVCRALEYTKERGLVFKEPKSRRGRRCFDLSATLVAALIEHKAKQDDYRKKLGAGYHENDLVVCVEDGSIWKPPAFDSSYRQLLKRRKLTGPTFHALRHSNASFLREIGTDAKEISERLGHSRVSFTLDRYVHLFAGQQKGTALKLDALFKAARDKTHPSKGVS
jgi:integrase